MVEVRREGGGAAETGSCTPDSRWMRVCDGGTQHRITTSVGLFSATYIPQYTILFRNQLRATFPPNKVPTVLYCTIDRMGRELDPKEPKWHK